MGTILNDAQVGDPISDLTTTGFGSLPEALEYVNNGFRGGEPVFSRDLQRGNKLQFEGNPMAVFWDVAPDGQGRLLSVTQIFGDLNLAAGSVGAQFTLRRA